MKLLRTGDLDRAERLYQALVQQHPTHPDAWHHYGVLATQQGRPDLAVERIRRALEFRPGDAGFLLNLGVAYQALGRSAEAEECFRQSVAAKPDFPEAHNNLAGVLHSRRCHDEAMHHWRQAFALRPDFADVHYNLAFALTERRLFDDALPHALEAVRLRPQHAQSQHTLGNILTELKRFAEAEAAFREALRLNPNQAAVAGNLAQVLRRQGRFDEALAAASDAVRIDPASADSHNELGAVLGCLGRADEAAVHLWRSLWFRPNNPEAHTNLGTLCNNRRQFDQACNHFREALRLEPNLVEASCGLARALCRQGRLDDAIEVVREGLKRRPGSANEHAQLAEFLAGLGLVHEAIAEFREALRLIPEMAVAHSSLLITLNFLPEWTRDDLFAESRRWAECHARVPALGPAPDHDRDPDRRLRIGYVSPDLVQHILVHFFEPVLIHHRREAFEIFVYSDVLIGDATTDRLRGLTPNWRSIVGQPDERVAKQIRDDRIDILVDLAGHTGGRLGVFARKPAPVQVSWLGYPGTTGLDAIQFRLTDAIADPPREPVHHTEELVRLPAGFSSYLPPANAPDVAPPPFQSRGHVTFGSLHKLEKLNGKVLDLWCELLRAVPTAKLLVFRSTLRGSARDRIRNEFTRRGIPEDRGILQSDPPANANYLDMYRDVDILLDAFPWSGHATACEALWMGVPVITLAGNRHASRMVASVLTQVGRQEWIASAPEDHVAKAVALAADSQLLASLRGQLRDAMRTSPVCDGAGFTRALEAAYRQMWRRVEQ